MPRSLSPAESLAHAKRRERKPRNKSLKNGPVICHCRARREALQLTIRDVADAVGMSVAGLHGVEMGGNAEISTALKLCAFYGAKLDELWEAKPHA